jgi:hypothetical protein
MAIHRAEVGQYLSQAAADGRPEEEEEEDSADSVVAAAVLAGAALDRAGDLPR